MWLPRLFLNYLLLPTLAALVGIVLWRVLLEEVLPDIFQPGDLTGADIELLGVATAGFVSAFVATFVQRTFAGGYRKMRGTDYKEGDQEKELF